MVQEFWISWLGLAILVAGMLLIRFGVRAAG
jgi:hypothetical protein